jgi:glycosyltransferase involved in cell wall biosynthesis
MPTFAYLVTIHNSMHCLAGTLQSLQMSKSYDSQIIAILDGCTDKSEQIVDDHSHDSGQEVIKLYTPDVHEILALNAGLRYIQERHRATYVVTIQDDLWQLDPDFEALTLRMFHDNSRLVHLVYRLGANYTPNMDIIDMCENYCGVGFGTTLALHQYTKRMIGGKSPSTIPMWFMDKYGLLDENLAPRGHDDTELSLRALTLGYETMVLATQYRSDLSWGGTRRKVQDTIGQDARNGAYIKAKYQDLLNNFQITDDYREIRQL